MSGSVQAVPMELYLHDYKLEALSSALEEQGTSVEEQMQEYLIELYADSVPYEEQQKIRARIDAEAVTEVDKKKAVRQFTAFLRKMDDYCRQQTGQSLKDYSAGLMAEEKIALPAGPTL